MTQMAPALERLLAADARWTARLCIAGRPGPLRSVAAVLAHSGDSWFWAAALALVWWRGGPKWQQWSVLLFSAIFVVALGVQALKLLLRRSRPAGEWGAIYRKTDPHSFPSGHATRAALLLGLGYVLGPPWFAGLMLLYSPAMALARIAMGVHYLSDVVAGYALGLLLAVVLGRWFGAAGWLPIW